MRLIGKHQTFDGLAVNEMPVDEFWNVIDGDIAVPNLVGIHDDGYTVRALIEAAGVVGSHQIRHAPGGDQLFQLVAHLSAAFGFAAALRVIGGALVDAYEYVSRKTRHG